MGRGGKGEVGAEAGRGGREEGDGKGNPEERRVVVLMLSCGVPLEELLEDE